MASQPFYHSASILFTTKDTSIGRSKMTELLRLAFGQLTERGLEGILVDSIECEEISDEPGDPADL